MRLPAPFLFFCIFGAGMIGSLSFWGCATTPYQPGLGDVTPNGAGIAADERQIERGEPYWLLDGVGHYLVSLPTKLILWKWKAENHDISPETEEVLRRYLASNNLTRVKVRMNEYSPGGEWRRLVDNESVAWGWRYTFGAVSWLFYTILPGRIFGGDSYNPYTNTINLYSDVPAIALHEGGHAKDFAETHSKGTYAAVGILPLSSLFFEAQATNDALGYVKANQCTELMRSSYKVLYPAYGTYLGGAYSEFAGPPSPIAKLISLAVVIPAHIVGRIKSSNVEELACGEAASADDTPTSAAPDAEPLSTTTPLPELPAGGASG